MQCHFPLITTHVRISKFVSLAQAHYESKETLVPSEDEESAEKCEKDIFLEKGLQKV
jgi:hypothetical protein